MARVYVNLCIMYINLVQLFRQILVCGKVSGNLSIGQVINLVFCPAWCWLVSRWSLLVWPWCRFNNSSHQNNKSPLSEIWNEREGWKLSGWECRQLSFYIVKAKLIWERETPRNRVKMESPFSCHCSSFQNVCHIQCINTSEENLQPPVCFQPVIPAIITSRVSGRGNKFGPVCVSVCHLVSALTAKRIDLRTWQFHVEGRGFKSHSIQAGMSMTKISKDKLNFLMDTFRVFRVSLCQ